MCTYQYLMKSLTLLQTKIYISIAMLTRLQFAHLIGALKMALLLMLVISFDPWAYIGHEVTPPSPHIIVQEHHLIYAQSDHSTIRMVEFGRKHFNNEPKTL